jgi:hypothetical protein
MVAHRSDQYLACCSQKSCFRDTNSERLILDDGRSHPCLQHSGVHRNLFKLRKPKQLLFVKVNYLEGSAMTGLTFVARPAGRQVARDHDGRHKPRGDRSAVGGCMTWPMVECATSRRARGEPRSRDPGTSYRRIRDVRGRRRSCRRSIGRLSCAGIDR